MQKFHGLLLMISLGGCSSGETKLSFECDYQVATMTTVPGNAFHSLYRLSPNTVEQYDEENGAYTSLCDGVECSVNIAEDEITFSVRRVDTDVRIKKKWNINRNNGAMSGEQVYWSSALGREVVSAFNGTCEKASGVPEKAI